METKRWLVIDTGPIIKQVHFDKFTETTLYTVPEVLSEVRDKAARQLLLTLSSPIIEREPSDHALAESKSKKKQESHSSLQHLLSVFPPPLILAMHSEEGGRLCFFIF